MARIRWKRYLEEVSFWIKSKEEEERLEYPMHKSMDRAYGLTFYVYWPFR